MRQFSRLRLPSHTGHSMCKISKGGISPCSKFRTKNSNLMKNFPFLVRVFELPKKKKISNFKITKLLSPLNFTWGGGGESCTDVRNSIHINLHLLHTCKRKKSYNAILSRFLYSSFIRAREKSYNTLLSRFLYKCF